MKNKITCLFFLLATRLSFSQTVAINTTGATGNASAILDVSSVDKGILLPRMGSAQISSISNPAKGLMVYDSVKNQLLVNMGSPLVPNWQTVVSNSGWGLSGNTGTNPATNFLGTTDVAPIIFKFNNIRAGIIDSTTNNTSLGFRTFDSITTGTHNIGLGYKSLNSNKDGFITVP